MNPSYFPSLICLAFVIFLLELVTEFFLRHYTISFFYMEIRVTTAKILFLNLKTRQNPSFNLFVDLVDPFLTV